ncbi:MAG: lysine biosynthesis protein LysW [Synergistaceae bacterium]|nr:lysine biosynthesis protein LysW [Synergistaceae bacterium]
MSVKCCVCEADVNVAEDAMVGELITCTDCGTELEVISTSPVTLQEAPEVQEDWGE